MVGEIFTGISKAFEENNEEKLDFSEEKSDKEKN